MTPSTVGVLKPDWPAPSGVHAAFTLRSGGVSLPPYDSLNLGVHVGDAPDRVAENRTRARDCLRLPDEPAWLEQVHGTDVVELGAREANAPADAVITRRPGRVCAVQVADCMPVLFAARDASVVGVAHAGWRGLSAGVLEAIVARLDVPSAELVAWLGPAICAQHFEVGAEVRAGFVARDGGAADAFAANARGRWQCDLAALARRRLATLGIAAVYGGEWCTYTDRERFFSFRRDGQCGRMAALIWLE